MSKNTYIGIIFGILLAASVIAACYSKGIMDANLSWEQGWAYIIDGEITSGPAYDDITAGHTAYQTALLINQISMWLAILFAAMFGGASWELISHRIGGKMRGESAEVKL